MLCKVIHRTGRVSANTRPRQLHWGNREMGTAISCIECSQMAGIVQKSVETRESTVSSCSCSSCSYSSYSYSSCSCSSCSCSSCSCSSCNCSSCSCLSFENCTSSRMHVYSWWCMYEQPHHHKNCRPKQHAKSPIVHDILQPIPGLI